MNATLHIEWPGGKRSVHVADELSIGRTDAARFVIDDPGLSRVNNTFFIEDGELFVTDENSLNGTFINDEQLIGPPRKLR
ncbi:MAG TPA: FHA domain-containing protein, partial [Pyrinomonadaceae bacterium]|nr:FHA domain-containing protein [Pyrinomonadaceae bacterium]